MKKGIFEAYYLNYKDEEGAIVPSKTQATTLLDHARTLIANGAIGVAITYSANYGQTVDIDNGYKAGQWKIGITGAFQADVMTKMEGLLGDTYSDLQGKMRIAPITTMSYETPPYGEHTHEEVIKSDLANIKALLDNGWTVLGWQNQDSGTDGFAVGGGVSKRTGQYPQELSDVVQATLKQFATNYSGE